MNDEASSIYGYTSMFISKADSKIFRMQIPKVLSARHAFVVVVVFCLPRKLFMSYLMIFKCSFVICLCSLIVDICYVSRTGEAVSLLPQNLETV